MRSLKNIERDTDGAKLAGVCAALSDRWDVDPLLVRAGFCILGLSNGVGLVLYGAAWLMWPARGGIAPIDQVAPGIHRLPKFVWWGGLITACIVVMSSLSGFTPFGIGPAVVMAVLWWVATRRQRNQRRRVERQQKAAAPLTTGSSAFDDAALRWQARVAEHHRTRPRGLGAGAAGQPYGAGLPPVGEDHGVRPGHRPYGGPQPQPFRPTPPQQPGQFRPQARPAAEPATATVTAPREPAAVAEDRGYPSELPESTLVTASDDRPRRLRPVWPWVLLASAVALVLVESASRPTTPAVIYPAAVLAVIGFTLMLCTRRGRPRGLLAAGIVMVLVTATTAAITPYTRLEVPVTNATVGHPTTYEVGNVTEDLREVTITEPTERRVDLEVGQLTVLVPREANVNVHWSSDAGSVHLRPRSQPEIFRESGVDLSGTTRLEGTDPNAPTLELYVHVEVGDLEVRQ